MSRQSLARLGVFYRDKVFLGRDKVFLGRNRVGNGGEALCRDR